MTADEIIRLVITIATTVVASVGGAGVIILGLSSWIGKIWADRIFLRANAQHEKDLEEIRNRYTIELEHLRAEIAERRDVFNTTFDALSSGFTTSRDRVLNAIEALWRGILEVRQFTSGFFFFYSMLLPKEYPKALSGEIKNVLPPVTQDEFDKQLVRRSQSLDEVRPFVGESLWRLYRIYFAFAMRLSLKVVWGQRKGNIPTWDKDFDGTDDTLIHQTLREIFTEAELQSLAQSDQPFAPVQSILSAIELKIVSEMNEWIFGRQLVRMSIEEQQRLDKMLAPLPPTKGAG